MNRRLGWALGLTAALSAWALFDPVPSNRPSGTPAVVVASPRTVVLEQATAQTAGKAPGGASPVSSGRADTSSSTLVAVAALPAHWPQPQVEPATRNPFATPQPPPPPKSLPQPAVVVAPALSPPLPVADYRFWGRMTTFDGRHLVYVVRGAANVPVAIEVGSKLEDGWAVEAIGDNAIVLAHAATEQRSTLSIPVDVPASRQ